MKEAFPEAELMPVPRVDLPLGDYLTGEDRHAQLKRLITAVGKQNSRGVFETKGICHNGVSDTALMFNPKTGAIACLNGCTYEEVLTAFGLEKTVIINPRTGRSLLTV